MTPRPGAMNHSDSGAALAPVLEPHDKCGSNLVQEWGNLPDAPIEKETAP